MMVVIGLSLSFFVSLIVKHASFECDIFFSLPGALVRHLLCLCVCVSLWVFAITDSAFQ